MDNLYDKVKCSYKYRAYRFLWVRLRDISSWAGRKCVKMLQDYDRRDTQ